jgi:hypothetical protein
MALSPKDNCSSPSMKPGIMPSFFQLEMGWVDIRFEPLYFRRISQMF